MSAANTELALNDDRRHLPVATPTPLALMQQVIAGGITAENVAVMKELVAMDREMRKEAAATEFAGAFARLQASLKGFKPTKAVPDKNGGTRYTYVPYEQIMREVQPIAEREGLSISFSTDFADGRIVQTCTLTHASGHSKDYKSFVRAGAGPYGATETQADGAAMTYAKRYALCNALNITVERDNDGIPDARLEGQSITFEQAQTLKELAKEVGADVPAFLKYAGASKFEDIGTARYDALFAALQKKARK